MTTLGLVRFLTENPPSKENGEQDKDLDKDFLISCDKWNHSEYLCTHYIMNCLRNSLYNVYSKKKCAKEPWEALEQKYEYEDASI